MVAKPTKKAESLSRAEIVDEANSENYHCIILQEKLSGLLLLRKVQEKASYQQP